MTISAPYRFVPLSRLIVLPDWAEQVSHDRPFADGLCGELKLRLTAHTRLCVGGRQEKATNEAAGRVHFFRAPDGRFAIPGSSLKGMLRNVMEIAGFAHFRQVEDQRLGVRDLSEAGEFYKNWMIKNPSRPGWMRFDDGKWKIRPCQFSRLSVADLLRIAEIDPEIWADPRNNSAMKRYPLLGGLREIRFNRKRSDGSGGQWKALPVRTGGQKKGVIVLTGRPGPKKRSEFVFHDESAIELEVPAEVMAGFRRIHESSAEWGYWRKKLEGQGIRNRVPVFFHTDPVDEGGQVRSLGLAMMYKLPYTNSVHDAVGHTDPSHLSDKAADFPELIFGRLGGDDDGLRGRVNIGFAFVESANPPVAGWSPRCVLSQPKPTFYPTYIRQDGEGQFRQLMDGRSELAGWKRYQSKREHFPRLPPKIERNRKVQATLETLPRGTRFSFTVRFHNLRRVELGALLWSIDFGGRSELRHGLGVGKPYGLGQVGLELTDSRLRPNDCNQVIGDRAEFLQKCRDEFVLFMDEYLKRCGASLGWETCGPMKALLDYAMPKSGRIADAFNYLPDTGYFSRLKERHRLQEVVRTFHATEPLKTS